MEKRKLVIVIAGPTASGKTALGVALAKFFQTEILSADSRQIYQEMRIGTAVPDDEQLSIVKHHFIQCVSIHEAYNAGRYESEANLLLDRLFENHEVVLMVGGTGLYLRSALTGFHPMPDVPSEIRQAVQNELEHLGLDHLLRELRENDPEFFRIAETKNPRRIQRAIELMRASGKTITELRSPVLPQRNYETIKIGLHPPKEILVRQISERVEQMFQNGLLEEARALLPYRQYNALQAVGYPEVFEHLTQNTTVEFCKTQIVQNTMAYAKRQLTWFKKETDFRWFESNDFGIIRNYVLEEIKLRK